MMIDAVKNRADVSRSEKTIFLNGYRWAIEKIDVLEERLARLDDRLYAMRRSIISDMPKGGKGKDTVDLIGDKEELSNDINEKLKEAYEKKRQIENAIDSMDDDRLSVILSLKYIDGLTLEEIASKLHYSNSHMGVLHRLALDEFNIPREY
ncbi:MAG: DUF1492 domain-containing protein [Clostridia bacterium]|nr:DUF1492 domain-containing protein [Clostridia bacterium]